MKNSKYIVYKGVKYLRGKDKNSVIELIKDGKIVHRVRMNIHGQYYKSYEKSTTEIKKNVFKTKVIECTPSDFKDEILKLRKLGIMPDKIETEPIKYRYTISYHINEAVSASIEDEQWRDIPGEWFGYYQMSNLGRIRTIRILGDGVPSFQAGGKRKTINRKKLFKEVWS